MQAPVDECVREVCKDGCTNVLKVSSEPSLVNANGSSLVGVMAVVEAECSCGTDDGVSPIECSPNSCLHGGQCNYNKDSQTTRLVLSCLRFSSKIVCCINISNILPTAVYAQMVLMVRDVSS